MNISVVDYIGLELNHLKVNLFEKSAITQFLQNPFKLGQIYLPFSVNTFSVIKAKDEFYIYEFMKKSKSIKITEIASNIISYSIDFPVFQTAKDCEIEFPIFKNLKYPLFGLEEVENELKIMLNGVGNSVVVMHGPRGCGKKSLMKRLADEMPNKSFFWINCLTWFNEKDYLKIIYQTLIANKSIQMVLCCYFINSSNLNEEFHLIIDNLVENSQIDIKILLEIPNSDSVDFRRRKEVFVKIIDKNSRFELFKYLINRSTGMDNFDDPEWKKFSDNQLNQFTGKDLTDFIDNVYRKFKEITLERLKACRKDSNWIPSELLAYIADLEPLHWVDIGGYESVKVMLKNEIEEPLKNGKEFVKGVLFHGPPGCSKTMFVRALATETGLNLISIKPSTIMRGYVGESEMLLRQIFDRAVALQPSILFIDEIDMIFPSRDHLAVSPVSQRMMSELLMFLNGINEKPNVIFVAATNFKDKLDAAVMRSGRMGLHIEIGLPDQVSRESILGITFSDQNDGFIFADDVKENFSAIAERLSGKSGAEIVEFGRQVRLGVRRALPLDTRYTSSGILIRKCHVDSCLSGMAIEGNEISCEFQSISIGSINDNVLKVPIETGNEFNLNRDELFDCEDLVEDISSFLLDDVGKCLIVCDISDCGKMSLVEHLESTMQQTIFIRLSDKLATKEISEVIEVINHGNSKRKDMVVVVDGMRKMSDDFCEAVQLTLINEAPNVKVMMIFEDLKLVPSQLDGFVNKKVCMSLPKDTEECLKHMIYKILNIKSSVEDIEELVKNLHGFTPKDIRWFLKSASVKYSRTDMRQLIEFSREIENTSKELDHQSQPLHWTDIGGYETVKTMLIENIEMPIKHGLEIPKGILFHGPPGCPKTMFVNALATECQLKMFNVGPSDIMRGIVGESEAAFRAILSQALESSPSLIFIEKIDLLIPKRSSNSKSNVCERILSELMTFLSGIETKKNQNVMIVATTNELHNVDEALLRPGRLSLIVPIGLPDQKDRESILKIGFSDLNFQTEHEIISNISTIAESLTGLSGAEIVGIVREMKRKAQFHNNNENVSDSLPTIKYQYFREAISASCSIGTMMELLKISCQEPSLDQLNIHK